MRKIFKSENGSYYKRNSKWLKITKKEISSRHRLAKEAVCENVKLYLCSFKYKGKEYYLTERFPLSKFIKIKDEEDKPCVLSSFLISQNGSILLERKLDEPYVRVYEMATEKEWTEDLIINLNINEMLKRFQKEYDFLYDSKSYVAGTREAVEEFDELIQYEWFKTILNKFNKKRNDIITSDREAAAFMFVLNDMVTEAKEGECRCM